MSFFKVIIISSIFFSVVGSANNDKYLSTWSCLAVSARANEADVESYFNFNVYKGQSGSILLKSFVGHVRLGADLESAKNQYYSIFNFAELRNNAKYRPRVYTNHFQFKEVNDLADNDYDGGAMAGEFVISKNILDKSVKEVSAHYIFQSGDHMGGAIDYKCVADLY